MLLYLLLVLGPLLPDPVATVTSCSVQLLQFARFQTNVTWAEIWFLPSLTHEMESITFDKRQAVSFMYTVHSFLDQICSLLKITDAEIV